MDCAVEEFFLQSLRPTNWQQKLRSLSSEHPGLALTAGGHRRLRAALRAIHAGKADCCALHADSIGADERKGTGAKGTVGAQASASDMLARSENLHGGGQSRWWKARWHGSRHCVSNAELQHGAQRCSTDKATACSAQTGANNAAHASTGGPPTDLRRLSRRPSYKLYESAELSSLLPV